MHPRRGQNRKTHQTFISMWFSKCNNWLYLLSQKTSTKRYRTTQVQWHWQVDVVKRRHLLVYTRGSYGPTLSIIQKARVREASDQMTGATLPANVQLFFSELPLSVCFPYPHLHWAQLSSLPNPEGAIHHFPTENHGLRPGDTKSYISLRNYEFSGRWKTALVSFPSPWGM